MKVIASLLAVVCLYLITIPLANASYNDPPKDAQCVNKCGVKYTPEYDKCHAVEQCQAYVEYEVGNCIHECPDAK